MNSTDHITFYNILSQSKQICWIQISLPRKYNKREAEAQSDGAAGLARSLAADSLLAGTTCCWEPTARVDW